MYSTIFNLRGFDPALGTQQESMTRIYSRPSSHTDRPYHSISSDSIPGIAQFFVRYIAAAAISSHVLMLIKPAFPKETRSRRCTILRRPSEKLVS